MATKIFFIQKYATVPKYYDEIKNSIIGYLITIELILKLSTVTFAQPCILKLKSYHIVTNLKSGVIYNTSRKSTFPGSIDHESEPI